MEEKLTLKIAVLAGDGIGPEVMAEALKVLRATAEQDGFTFDLTEALVGGIAIDKTGKALPQGTLTVCEGSDAILFGSVGGPKWESLPPQEQPERGALLRLRRHFQLYANLRPAMCFPELVSASPLRADLVAGGFEILCIRELTGGLYFGEPKYTRTENGELIAVDTMIYRESEIRRIAELAFRIARRRGKGLVSVDKANVLENSQLWRKVVRELGEREYPDVELRHLLVDNAAMQFIRYPRNFDVVVTENLFGDILSDELAMMTGSIGMLPSASLGTRGEGNRRFGLFEPSGGSAPDIAGKGIANPLGAIASAAMLLRYSANLGQDADDLESAIANVISDDHRTPDIARDSAAHMLTTSEMGKKVEQYFAEILDQRHAYHAV
ncbi:MAG: 3-isopropylmalate dehydrogenase, partial [Verrucomicrobia bacterium]|nr:3-isopropylmalate dehydrogenase [Verrucomicrobiota bacterium]